MANQLNQNQRFNIDNFRTSIRSAGYQKSTDFSLIIDSLPSGLAASTNYSGILEQLIFRVQTTPTPGVSMATHEVRRQGIGPVEMKPYAPIFAPQDLTIIGDGDGAIYNFFQAWLNLVFNFSFETGMDSASIYNSNQRTYEVTYKSRYKTNLTFVSYSNTGDEIIKVKMLDAYPMFLAPAEMSWESQNSIMRFNVSFAYTDWYYDRPNDASTSLSTAVRSVSSRGINQTAVNTPPRNLRPDGSGN